MIPVDWLRGEVAVIGLGRSGDAAARLLRHHDARVYASDGDDTPAVHAVAEGLTRAGVSVAVGTHDLPRIGKASLVVTSPGVPPKAAPIVAARAAGVPVVSEVELALATLPDLKYVAVTGTNGKSTVTHLVAHLLRSLSLRAEAVGNIGTPLSEIALRTDRPEWVALELSSFQLHDTPSIRPAVGVLTNLSPDHLDRYDSVEQYFADKALLFRNATPQSRWAINYDDGTAVQMTRHVAGTVARYSAQGRLADAFYDNRGRELIVLDAPLMNRDELPLLGMHNVGNALAAALAVMLTDRSVRTLHGRARIAEGLRTATALPHRLQPVGEYGGVLWINDSKATNVESARVGIESMARPTVLLLGGKHKGEPYSTLDEPIRKHCRVVLAYGAAAPEILHDLRDLPVEHVPGDFTTVIRRARAHARSGDAVLLSPACSSYDMFHNYEERGDRFVELARTIGRAVAESV